MVRNNCTMLLSLLSLLSNVDVSLDVVGIVMMWLLLLLYYSVILIVDVNVADIDECCSFSPCGLNTHCTNTEGSYTCECNFGFSRDVVNTDDCGKEMIVLLDMRIFYFAYFISVKWR